jgi:thiamine-monophosphate kinase
MLKNRERDIIDLISDKFNRFIGDDCAVWNEKSLVVTTDHMCEGVHFDLSFMFPEAVGWRLMAANASDIISMGSLPTHFLFNIAIPPDRLKTAERIIDGVKKFAGKYNIEIMGGDTTRAKNFMVGATMFGEKPAKPLLRSGARPGDRVYIAASTGLSHCGLLHLKNRSKGFEKSVEKFLFPSPFDSIPQNINDINCAIDISDSLISELKLIAEMSNVSLVIDYDAIPVDDEVKKTSEMFSIPVEKLVLGSGEEFILLFTSDKIIKNAFEIGIVTLKKEKDVEIFSKKSVLDLCDTALFSHFG